MTRRFSSGLIAAISAFALWGLSPLYFHALSHVDPMHVMASRILGSALLLGLALFWRGDLWCSLSLLVQRKTRRKLLLSAALLGSNWFFYIWAVDHNRLLEVSLGYFLAPLLYVAFGVIVFGETLRPVQWMAVLLAAAGVLNQCVGYPNTPVLALAIALSFTLYGTLRKQLEAPPLQSVFVELSLLVPPAVVWLALQPPLAIADSDPTSHLLLLAAGLTAAPVLLFGYAAPRLKQSTIGLVQYVAPSLHFLIATGLFSEPMTSSRVGSFAVIWLGIACYACDGVNRTRARRPSRPARPGRTMASIRKLRRFLGSVLVRLRLAS